MCSRPKVYSDLSSVRNFMFSYPLGNLTIIKGKTDKLIEKNKVDFLKDEVGKMKNLNDINFEEFKMSKDIAKALIGVKPVSVTYKGYNVEKCN